MLAIEHIIDKRIDLHNDMRLQFSTFSYDCDNTIIPIIIINDGIITNNVNAVIRRIVSIMAFENIKQQQYIGFFSSS
jgi:hypothetical protein